MIDDVLKEIREAEAQADEIVSEAQNKAKQIVQQAEIDAEKQKKPLFCNAATTDASRLTKRKQTRKKARRNPQKGQKSADELAMDHNLAASEKASELCNALVEKYCGKKETIEE